MTEGLITRLGQWIDRKWEAHATEKDLEWQEKKCISRMDHSYQTIDDAKNSVLFDVLSKINEEHVLIKRLEDGVAALKQAVSSELKDQWASINAAVENNDVADLKTRLEKLELYCGMTRKVDPTKAPVAKSAFSM